MAGQPSLPAAVRVHHVDLPLPPVGTAAGWRKRKKAILRPSGDQTGSLSAPGSGVSFSGSLPSAFMTADVAAVSERDLAPVGRPGGVEYFADVSLRFPLPSAFTT